MGTLRCRVRSTRWPLPEGWTLVLGLSDINRAFIGIPKRAESRQSDHLRDTFVDSGVSAALLTTDHEVLYGRRGTGKTHALRYLETQLRDSGDVVVYLDLRTIGSPEGLFGEVQVGAEQRVARLLVDLLGQVHEELLTAAIYDDDLITDATFVDSLDSLLEAITSVRVEGTIEVDEQATVARSTRAGAKLEVDVLKPTVTAAVDASDDASSTTQRRVRREGQERFRLVFGDVARALRRIADSLSAKRIWLLLDEWTSVPTPDQPLLGEFLVRCVLPLQRQFTVKIGAIEQQSQFRKHWDTGQTVGIELGADISATLNLDEFMVFEQNEDRARDFFQGLFVKHLSVGTERGEGLEIANERDLIRQGFTDRRAFDELVRAAEGVPRDAINIAAQAALLAQSDRISVPHVRSAARKWFEKDKESALQSKQQALDLLNWVVDEVIRGKRARGFLVNQRHAGTGLLLELFDARVLHLVRRGYSSQDEPGERYNVYLIDYGAYVDLINTNYEPQGDLPAEEGAWVEVPEQDLRALRRAVLDLDAFWEAMEDPPPNQPMIDFTS